MRPTVSRNLVFFWRSQLAVAAGAAVATAVLAGALVVGDSVRGSLRDLVEARLGHVDEAILSGGFLREELATEIGARLPGHTIAPALIYRGSAVHAPTGARASGLQILGVDERFQTLFEDSIDLERRPGQVYPSAVVNGSLARELGAGPGDEILVSIERPAEVPRETLVGREEATETVETIRLTLTAVVPDRGVGGFALAPRQTAPPNLFVDLGRLQRALFGRERPHRVNAILAGNGAPAETGDLAAALAERLELEDLGLVLRRFGRTVIVESRAFVLSPALAAGTLDYAAAANATAQPVLTYLANSISAGPRSIPYSTVSALATAPDGALAGLKLIDGAPAPALGENDILLNAWAAEDLAAEVGDDVVLTYYELGPRDEISETSRRLRLRGVVELSGLATDPHLTPEFPGMHEAADIAAWDPPFPMDLGRIRPRDEDYWDRYKSAPKAFVAVEVGRKLWASRFGDLTSVRLTPPDGVDGDEFAARLETDLPVSIGFERSGIAVRELRGEGLERARGATDFAGLFVALSMFLIASAALLVGLLFRLGIEQRARELGLLRAVGYPAGSVSRRFLSEGLLVALVGVAVGLAGALAYAWAMLAGLRTWWLPAIGAPVLFLHLEPASLVLGALGALGVVAATIFLALRRFRSVPAPSLLAGSIEGPDRGDARPGTRSLSIALGATLGAAALLLAGVATGNATSPNIALGVGAALLVAGIGAFAWRSGALGRGGEDRLGTSVALSMGVRNSGRNRGRSILSVALIASAVFTLVVAGANRQEGTIDVRDRASGAGGFALVAESDAPIHVDLNDDMRRRELGFSEEDVAALEPGRILPLRLLPGEDASCLNLYRPEKPRVLGITPELVARGGFEFQTTIDDEEIANPWDLLSRNLGPGVVAAIGDANSVQWILHLGLGEDLVIRDERGEEIRLRFVALLKRSLFRSEVLIAEERFLELFPSHTGYRYFLIDPPLGRESEIANLLERALSPFGFDAASSAERLAAYQAVENTYISTFQTLGGLGLVLGTLGLGIVLLRNVLERRGELATLRAFGFRRALLARLVLLENGYLLSSGVIIGTVAGLIAAAPHILSASHRFPWTTVLLTLAVVFVAGMASSLVAVRGTLATPLLPALKAD